MTTPGISLEVLGDLDQLRLFSFFESGVVLPSWCSDWDFLMVTETLGDTLGLCFSARTNVPSFLAQGEEGEGGLAGLAGLLLLLLMMFMFSSKVVFRIFSSRVFPDKLKGEFSTL